MNPDRIAALAEEYRATLAEADRARDALYRAIRAERRRVGGASLRALSRSTGLSFARIAQIANGE